MPKNIDVLSNSRQIGVITLFEAFKVLKEEGGQLRGRDLFSKIENRVELSDWAKERYEKTGYVRWESILHFHSITAIKAGYLRKKKGVWYLTEEGEKAVELGALGLFESARLAYRQWKADNASTEISKDLVTPLLDEIADADEQQQATLDRLEEQALEGLKEFVRRQNPYQFQDMVAALLRAMGYFTPFVAPRGRDGGVDIVAYQDPLGVKSPRIKVQVKHRPEDSVAVSDVRSLLGLLSKDGEIGLFVTSGSFSNDSERLARESHVHVRLIDFDNFISLWQEFYDKLNDEEKNLLPLQPIYFLGSNE